MFERVTRNAKRDKIITLKGSNVEGVIYPTKFKMSNLRKNNDGEHDTEELQAFENVVLHFKNYRNSTLILPKMKEKQAKRLLDSGLEPLNDYFRMLDTVQDRIVRNSFFLKEIIADINVNDNMIDINYSGMDKIRSVLRQFTRDWSLQGLEERNQTYTPILNELYQLYSSDARNRAQVRILVPGAGLARLAHDIAQQGYQVQGNEFSFYMLLASDWVLNKNNCGQEWEIYPWIHSFSNMKSMKDIVNGVIIPDIKVGDGITPERFSMVGGDFLQVYSNENQKESWDTVVTCFFMDTATDIRKYIDIIYKVLKNGGFWINLGPLMYHFEDSTEDSIELPLDQVMKIIKGKGFKILRDEFRDCTYTNCPDSLLTYTYKCAFFTVQKSLISDDLN